MSKENPEPPAAGSLAPAPLKREAALPKWLYLAFLLAIACGITVYFGREPWLAAKIYRDLNNSGASLVRGSEKDRSGRVIDYDINDGIDDRFGIVQFRESAASIASLMSQCETHPRMAQQIFRRCMDEGNKSARLVALKSAFFLIAQNHLEQPDLERIIASIDGSREKDPEVRKAAQRALADMIVLKDVTGKLKYEALPAEIPKSEGEWPSPRIETLEETRDGAKQLRIRWSNPDTALAWWKQYGAKGKWSPVESAWVIP